MNKKIIYFLILFVIKISLYGESKRVAIIVNDYLFPKIESSLRQYINDLQNEGYSTNLRLWSLTNNPDPRELKSHLSTLYHEAEGLQGALFIGDLPIVMFEPSNENNALGKYYVHQESFLTDQFYMDLTGDPWEDTDHNGIYDRPIFRHGTRDSLEIWVSRLKASGLSYLEGLKEWDLINKYFEKNHNFRTGKVEYPMWNLLYIQSDHAEERHRVNNLDFYDSMDIEYTIPIIKNTAVNEFLYLQDQSAYEYVAWVIHGMPQYLLFDRCEYSHLPSWSTIDRSSTCLSNAGYITSYYLSKISVNPSALFAVPCSCWAGKYTENNYIMGTYLFKPEAKTLAMISATIPILDYSQKAFLQSMNAGLNFGQSYLELLNKTTIPTVRSLLIGRSKVLFGDGTLKRQKFMAARTPDAKKIGSHSTEFSANIRGRMTPIARINANLESKKLSWPELKISNTKYKLYHSLNSTDNNPVLIYSGKDAFYQDPNMSSNSHYWIQYFWDDNITSTLSEFPSKASAWPFYAAKNIGLHISGDDKILTVTTSNTNSHNCKIHRYIIKDNAPIFDKSFTLKTMEPFIDKEAMTQGGLFLYIATDENKKIEESISNVEIVEYPILQ